MRGGFNTIAPSQPTSVKRIHVEIVNGKATLNPEYHDPNVKRSYSKAA